jgi:hypothetical protein
VFEFLLSGEAKHCGALRDVVGTGWDAEFLPTLKPAARALPPTHPGKIEPRILGLDPSRCIPDTWANLLFTSKATTTPAAPAHHAPPQRACPGPKLVESSTPRSCCARSDVGRCSTVCGRHGSRNWQKLRYATCTQQDPLPDLLPNEKLMDSL